MNGPLAFTYSDGQSERLRQYDILRGNLTEQLPLSVPPRNEALRLAAGQAIGNARAVQLYLPWQQPLGLSIPQNVVWQAEPNLAVAQKYRCRTIMALMIMQAAEKLVTEGYFPVGDLAEFAFSEFAVWIPERSLPMLQFQHGQLALSLSTKEAIETGRKARVQGVHLASHEWERTWFSVDERVWLEKVLLENAKHGFDAGTRVRLLPPQFRYDAPSDSLFYPDQLGSLETLELIGRLQRGEAQACYVWAPTGVFHPLLEVQQLKRPDFTLLRRGFQTTQLDGPVWELRLASPKDSHTAS